jgi:hypothetical protein
MRAVLPLPAEFPQADGQGGAALSRRTALRDQRLR